MKTSIPKDHFDFETINSTSLEEKTCHPSGRLAVRAIIFNSSIYLPRARLP